MRGSNFLKSLVRRHCQLLASRATASSSAQFSDFSTLTSSRQSLTSSVIKPESNYNSCKLLFTRNFTWGTFSSTTTQKEELDASEPAAEPPSVSNLGTVAGTEDASLEPAFDPSFLATLTAVAEHDAIEQSLSSAWMLNRFLQRVMLFSHESSGTPWWMSIAMVTAGVRVAVFPVILRQIKSTYRMSQAHPHMVAAQQLYMDETARGNPNAQMEYAARVQGIWAKYDCHPLKAMINPLVQAPIFIGFFSALRSLSFAKVPSLMDGGMLWFTDLTVPDPTYALPLIASAIFLLNVELGAADGMQGQPAHVMSRLKTFARIMAVIMVPFTAGMPAAVFCYWIPSNLISLLQSIALKNKALRNVLKLPDMASVQTAAASAAGAQAAVVGKPVDLFDYRPTPRKKSRLSQNPRQQ